MLARLTQPYINTNKNYCHWIWKGKNQSKSIVCWLEVRETYNRNEIKSQDLQKKMENEKDQIRLRLHFWVQAASYDFIWALDMLFLILILCKAGRMFHVPTQMLHGTAHPWFFPLKFRCLCGHKDVCPTT